MKRLVTFPLQDGGGILIEVDEPEAVEGASLVASPDETAEQVTQTLESALESVRPAIERIRQSLHEINNPSEIEVEFGIKVSGEIGAFFASSAAEANFAVRLVWKNEKG